MSFTMKVVKDLLNHNFSVFLHRKDNLNGYGGWFGSDDNDREFVVALDHHMGFEILLHEYCHFLQWKHDRKFWDDSTEYYDLLFDWIENKELCVADDELNKSLNTILSIEHDCEKRVLKLTSLNPIDGFDRNKYIKAANCYIWSYHINRELRQRPKNPIYTEKLLDSMPCEFNDDLSFYMDKNNLTKEMRTALLEEYELAS